jgi:hypothetical protein
MAVATHEPPPPAQVNAAVPAGLSDLVMRLLQKDPARRPATAQALVDALRQLERAPAATTASYAPAPPGRAGPARRSRKVLLSALGAAVAAAVLAVVFFWPRPDGTEGAAETGRAGEPEPSAKPSTRNPLPVVPREEDRRTGPVVDLLPLLNVEKDGLYGRWARTDDGVTFKDGHGYLEFPYHPPDEYDFRIEFTCRAGTGRVSQVVAHANRSFSYVMNATPDAGFGLGKITGKKANKNPTTRRRALTLNERHVCTIRIRKDRVVVEVDGENMADWKTDYSDLSYPPQAWKGRDRSALGLALHEMETVLHRAEVVEITGPGRFMRPGDPAARQAEERRGPPAKGGKRPGT